MITLWNNIKSNPNLLYSLYIVFLAYQNTAHTNSAILSGAFLNPTILLADAAANSSFFLCSLSFPLNCASFSLSNYKSWFTQIIWKGMYSDWLKLVTILKNIVLPLISFKYFIFSVIIPIFLTLISTNRISFPLIIHAS